MSIHSETTAARAALGNVYDRLRATGCAAPADVAGQLIRPLLCMASARSAGAAMDESLWSATAALQLAHEASLLHDDVIDDASERRSAPTLVAARGVTAALVEGDHLLTTAYRLAAATGSAAFVTKFAYAVERTVAGEKLQGRNSGVILDETVYRGVISAKSGELLGCALAAAALVHDRPGADACYALGRRIGTLYQMLDDLLDYCPAIGTGKPAFSDFRQRRWTWPLLELRDLSFDDDVASVRSRLMAPDAGGTTPLRRCLLRLEREADMVRASISAIMPNDTIATALVLDWIGRAADAVRTTERAVADEHVHAALVQCAPSTDALAGYFRTNSRSFSFAARLFPSAVRRQIEELYAFCRVTDDIADDESVPVADRMARLDVWCGLAGRAYHGDTTGIALLDQAMAGAARARVPFEYVEALIEGMRMDLRGTHYETIADLREYSYRVAGVVGQWVTRLCGVHDAATLERAASLGHAMQLTNILRDVGEDFDAGRVYLPADVMRHHGIDRVRLREYRTGAAVDEDYRDLVEHLMARADADYEIALEAAAALPSFFRRPVVVAAHVYRGIHDAIRANGYDNLARRARTDASDKLRLAARALRGVPLGASAAPMTRRTTPVATVARSVPGALRVLLLLAISASAVSAQPADAADRYESLAAAVAAAPDSAALQLDAVRVLFFLAAEDGDRVEEGHERLAAIRGTDPVFAAAHAPLLLAYDGAFTALEARHGVWPPSRLRAVRQGLRDLDAAVSLAPEHVEVRYLRAVNTHYLPGLFGRGDSAREDVAAVARLLLDGSAHPLPAELQHAIVHFLLDTDRLHDRDVARLRALLESTATDRTSG